MITIKYHPNVSSIPGALGLMGQKRNIGFLTSTPIKSSGTHQPSKESAEEEISTTPGHYTFSSGNEDARTIQEMCPKDEATCKETTRTITGAVSVKVGSLR